MEEEEEEAAAAGGGGGARCSGVGGGGGGVRLLPLLLSAGRLRAACWLVAGGAGLASGFFTVLYSLRLSRAQAAHWLASMALAQLQGLLLVQPLKVLALTGIFSLMRRSELWRDRGQERELRRALLLAQGRPLPPPPAAACRPPPLQPAARPQERAARETKLYACLRDIAVQLMFLAVLMVLCYAERTPSEFYLNDALQRSFMRHVGSIQNLEQVYGWARHTLLPSIYRGSEGLARDANAFLVGSVRLRQIRAEGDPEKRGPAFFQPWHELCAASQDDGGCPHSHWEPHDRAQENAWVYQSETTLAEYPTRGTFAVYPGGGYLADLGRNGSHANRVLHALAQDKWLDRCTRAVLVEFTVYNANVNLFCAVTVMLESNGIGKRGGGPCSFQRRELLRPGPGLRGGGGLGRPPSPITPQPDYAPPSPPAGAVASSTALQILRLYPSSQMLVPLACAHLAFLLLLLYDIVAQGRGLKRQKWRHFRAKRNLLDASRVLISVTVVGLYVRRGLLAASVLREHRQDRSRFVRVSAVANTDAALTYLIAFLVALATVKLWNLLRLNPRMHLITRTLQKAWDEIPGFLLTLLVLLTAYAFASNLLFGWSIVSFKSFSDSVVTIVGLLAGIFNYKAVLALDPVLGSLLLVSSILSMVFVVLNLLVSALLTVFSREMKALKASKEESVGQLVQLKISSLLGIKKGGPLPACGGAAED